MQLQNLGASKYGVESTVSNDEYSSFKNDVKKFAPKMGVLDFKTIRFGEKCDVYFKMKDDKFVPLDLSPNAFKKLTSELGLNQKFDIDNEPNTKQVVMNVLKGIKPDTKMNFVMKRNGEISDLSLKENCLFEYDSFFNNFERVMNKSKELELNQLSLNLDDCSLMLNVRSNKEIGYDKEVFKTGISFNNTNKGLLVNPFLYRLICTNGITTTSESEKSFLLKTPNQKSVSEYIEYLNELKKNQYQPLSFIDKWKKASKTQASISEVLQTETLIKSQIGDNKIQDYLPNFDSMIEKVESNFGNIKNMNKLSLSNLKSPFKVSDCINAITDVASHQKIAKPRHLQIAAGNMLYKKSFDTTNILKQIF